MTTFLSRYNVWAKESATPSEVLPLEEYVRTRRGGNHIARDLARCHGDGEPLADGLDDDELFERARRALDENFAFCGITEYFDESLFLACDLLGWKDIGVWKRRMSCRAGRPPPISTPRWWSRSSG